MKSNLHPIFEEILKPFEPKQDTISEAMGRIYDLAIDHATAIAREHYIDPVDSITNAQIDSIIKALKALKNA